MYKISIKRVNKRDVKRNLKDIKNDILNCCVELNKIHNDTRKNLLNMKG